MRVIPVLLLVAAAFALGFYAAHLQPQTALAASINPSTGYTIHVDAQRHFGDEHPKEVAHHWCKAVSGGMLECLIFDSDKADARLVEVETIVSASVYKSLPADEQALWHYHKDEIPKVNASMPDMTPAQAKAAVAMLTPTYGKVYMLWDPMTNKNPVGQPSVIVLH